MNLYFLTSKSSTRTNSYSPVSTCNSLLDCRKKIKEDSKSKLPLIIKVGMRVDNDVLIRCRNYVNEKTRTSLFRVYFHTSFITGNALGFSKVLLIIKCSHKLTEHIIVISMLKTFMSVLCFLMLRSMNLNPKTHFGVR